MKMQELSQVSKSVMKCSQNLHYKEWSSCFQYPFFNIFDVWHQPCKLYIDLQHSQDTLLHEFSYPQHDLDSHALKFNSYLLPSFCTYFLLPLSIGDRFICPWKNRNLSSTRKLMNSTIQRLLGKLRNTFHHDHNVYEPIQMTFYLRLLIYYYDYKFICNLIFNLIILLLMIIDS